MIISINGKIAMGWRLDDLEAGREGMDFINNPFALVPAEKDAKFIALACNQHHALMDALHKVLVMVESPKVQEHKALEQRWVELRDAKERGCQPGMRADLQDYAHLEEQIAREAREFDLRWRVVKEANEFLDGLVKHQMAEGGGGG